MRFTFASGERPLDGYTVKRGIGVGGFGEVFYAVSDAGKDVALKHVQRNLDVEIRGVGHCLNLKHPNLLSIFDIKYDDQGDAWVVMEYVAGKNLREIMDQNPNGMPKEEVNRWIGGIVSGVGYLHDHGIVHRDLKPGNIFLDEGIIKIGDYGLAKFISCSQRSGQTESVGTFHYMAPEIGVGRYGKEIDIYALGCVLHEMLTGSVPFDGESSQEIIMKHLTADPDLSHIDEPYRGVIANALAKDPDKRPDNAEAWIAPLRLGLAPRPGTTEQPLTPQIIDDPLVGEPAASKRGKNGQAEKSIADSAIHLASKTKSDSAEEEFSDRHAATPNAAASKEKQGPKEPIARAVVAGYRDLRRGWDSANFSKPIKIILLIIIAVLLMSELLLLFPLSLFLGCGYLIYLAIRAVYLSFAEEKSKQRMPYETGHGAQEIPVAQPVAAKQNRHFDARACLRSFIASRPPREKMTELLGSLLASAFICAILGILMLVFVSYTIEPHIMRGVIAPPLYAVFTLTSVVGAWAILIVSKNWEGKSGQYIQRRFPMLVIGLGVGLFAWGLCGWLRHDLSEGSTSERRMQDDWFDGDPWDDDKDGGQSAAHSDAIKPIGPGSSRELSLFLAYFGGLFFIPRWWRQADPLRDSYSHSSVRFSLWPIIICGIWAAFLTNFVPFPQPYGVMIACSISIAIQLASPWMSPQERMAICQPGGGT